MNNTMQNFSAKPNLTSVSTKDRSAFGKRGSAMTPIWETGGDRNNDNPAFNLNAPYGHATRNGKGVMLNTSSAHGDIKMPSIAGSQNIQSDKFSEGRRFKMRLCRIM